MLVPELDVLDLARSLRFYIGVLEFRVLFERPAERFAYLERHGAELMIQEAVGPGRRFRTARLEAPYGRGVNFQLRVTDVDAMQARAIEACAEIVVAMEERWYRVDVVQPGGRWREVGLVEVGNCQFVLADPDGYLWRPFRGDRIDHLGELIAQRGVDPIAWYGVRPFTDRWTPGHRTS